MGWKASLIIVELKGQTANPKRILKGLNWTSVRKIGEQTLESCLLPGDRSLSIGFYNDCAIICDDMQIAPAHFSYYISQSEKNLQAHFPESEILTVACMSTINYHGYALAAQGRRIRYKQVASNMDLEDFGDWMEEERAIYDQATFVEGIKQWRFDWSPDTIFLEDQLMEEFTFSIAKRLLGVNLTMEEGEELLESIPFSTYQSI